MSDEVIAYPPDSKWFRCIACGERLYGHPVSYLCPQPECRGTIHEDWRPNDESERR